jgi:UDP-3-O-acyl-N-acetylglucosamine deacetylase
LLIFGPNGPIGNTLRFPDECVRHKMLDVIGDLALTGCEVVAHVVAHRSGHALHAELAKRLVEQAESAGQLPQPVPQRRAA